MMGWLDRGDDPLLERVRLDRHGPFVFDRDQPLSFRDANGIHWLLLDSVYSGPPGHDGRGRTVHLIRPADLDLGGGMDTFAAGPCRADPGNRPGCGRDLQLLVALGRRQSG